MRSYVSPASEEALTAQQTLLGDALDELEDERPRMTDLYFVGFAPYAREDVFRRDMEVARDLLDDRFDTDGRSIVLINNPRTVLDEPLATVSNLRTTLNEIGAAIDTDDDVVMIYLESHGTRDHRLAVEFWPLRLDPLTPDAAAQHARRIRHQVAHHRRVGVLLGRFHRPAQGRSHADHDGIVGGPEVVRLRQRERGDLFRRARCSSMRCASTTRSSRRSRKARESIAERERAEGVSPPSDPQIFVGDAMAAKLPQLEAALRARRTGNTI